MTELLVWSAPLILGGLFAGAAAIVTVPALQMRQRWSKTTGTVVDVGEFESGGESTDRDWTASCPVLHNVAGYSKGSDVPILFDPQNPSSVRIDSFKELWLYPSLVCSVGTIAILVGLCLAISLA